MQRLLAVSWLILVVVFSGCGQQPVTQGAQEVVSVHFSLGGDVCGVVSAYATISAPDMSSIGPVALTVGQTSIDGSIAHVPAGPGRTVRVEAFDALARRVYFGSTTVDVLSGATTPAHLVLEQDTVNCPADGTGTVVIIGVIVPAGTADGGTSIETSDAGIIVAVTGVTAAPEQIALDQAGVLYLLDTVASRIERLSLSQRVLLPPLVGTLRAQTMAVAPDGTAAYLGYEGGRIDAFDLSTATATFLAATPETASSLLVAGGLLFTIDGSGAWASDTIYSRSTGARLATADWRSTGRSLVYAPTLETIFFLDTGFSPADVRRVTLTGGALGAEVDSPYHGSYDLSGRLTLLPDESGVLVGSGIIFETKDLTYRTAIGLSFTDAAFHDGKLYLAQPQASSTVIRVLDASYNIVATATYPGQVARLFVWQGKLVMVSMTSVGVEVRLVPL